MKYTYLLVDIGAVLFPLIFTFHPKLRFYKTWKAFFAANIITAIIFIAWDILYTRLGVWGFNAEYLIGLYFFNLPLEEVLFFICIPYACVFTYHCFSKLMPVNIFSNIKFSLSVFLISLLFIMTVVYYDKLYTTATFFSLAFILFLLQFVIKVKWMGRFYFSYLILLIPFVIINGILTGTGISNPVVFYDNTQNIGLRILTIPVEDIFYGMLLIILNVWLYESFKVADVLTNNT